MKQGEIICKWFIITYLRGCFTLFHYFTLKSKVWVAYPFCIGYGRLKVTRGYPNGIQEMNIETEFLAMGIARARQMTEKRGYPNDIRGNRHRKENMFARPLAKAGQVTE